VGLVHATAESLNKALDEYAKEVGWTMEYTILREGALMCRDAIIFTPPFVDGGGGGETKQSELVGRRAVDRDIRRIFVPQNDTARVNGLMMLKQLSNAAKNRDYSSFIDAKRQLNTSTVKLDTLVGSRIINDSDDTRAYRKAQNFFSKSSVARMNPPTTDMKAVHKQYLYMTRGGRKRFDQSKLDFTGRYFVKSKGELNAYIKSQQENVGRLKSAWWNVIEALPKPKKKGVEQNFGRKGVAAYVKKFPGNNIQSLVSTSSIVSLIIGNQIGNSDDVATRNNVLPQMIGNAVARINRDLEQMLNRDNQKFNNGEIR
jgi:hypothetical protein